MEWTSQMQDSLGFTLQWLARLGVIFGLLVWWTPCNRGMFWWKEWRAAVTDILYWFVTPLVVRTAFILGLSAVILQAFGEKPGFDALRQLPIWLQCVAILLVQDFMLYWIHRGFHTRSAWPFHAVHHSPKTLDWLSAGRFHLVNIFASTVTVDVAALCLGFSREALLVLVPINLYYSSMVHANLNWTFGPLRFVFASPVFHRWHHVAEGVGSNKNFASTFPFIDLLFGTFHMPKGEIPQNFGNGEGDFPEGYLGQLVYPFWKKTPPPDATEEVATTRKAA